MITKSKEHNDSRTHVKEIANTRLLVSVHHSYEVSANLEVFDVSWKGRVRKIYSFEEVSASRNIINIHFNNYHLCQRLEMEIWPIIHEEAFLGPFPLEERYFIIFTISLFRRVAIFVKLIRKTRWHPEYSSKSGIINFVPFVMTHLTGYSEENYITGLDFNPTGETVAAIDHDGTCLISDINTDNYLVHLSMHHQRGKSRNTKSLSKSCFPFNFHDCHS